VGCKYHITVGLRFRYEVLTSTNLFTMLIIIVPLNKFGRYQGKINKQK